MQQLAYKAYGEVTSRTGSDQQIELALFRDITQALQTVAGQDQPAPAVWADAIDRNLQLWTLLSTDLLNPENQLPADLRKSLINLGESVRRISYAVLSGSGDISELVDVNQTIMAGLAGSTQAVEEVVA